MNATDTNILVYSISEDEPELQAVASSLIKSLDPQKTVLLWQVASEFAAVAIKLSRKGRVVGDVRELLTKVRDQFPLVLPTPAVLDKALAIHLRHQVSYWDAALIAAAAEAGVTRLYSQDLQSAPTIEGVEIVNPFGRG